jgi:hypothetical protein
MLQSVAFGALALSTCFTDFTNRRTNSRLCRNAKIGSTLWVLLFLNTRQSLMFCFAGHSRWVSSMRGVVGDNARKRIKAVYKRLNLKYKAICHVTRGSSA